MAPMGTFCFVFLILRNLPMEIGQIIGIYVAHWFLTNTHVLVFGLPSPIFYKGQKNLNFWQHFRQHLELAAYYYKTGRNMENLKQ